jgi:AraC-like DNA-binding protein
MHTLTLTPDDVLYLTTPDGYLRIHPKEGETESFRRLILPDGSVLSPGINAVCLDREGGIWLGTYDKGALYTSPLSGLFDTHPIDIEVQPILTDVSLYGRPLQVGAEYDGRILMNVTAPYADSLRFAHNQNSLSFRFSTMNYVRPRSTCYRIRFSGGDGLWHTLSADSAGGLVSDRGDFYLPLVGLPPGEYTLEVNASTNPEHWNADRVRTIHFTIDHPWWQTPWAYALYALTALLIVFIAFRIYRYHLQRKNRESILLLRIQNLVEQVNRSEPSEAMVVLGSGADNREDAETEPSLQDKEFMMRATELVERHLSSPQYSVKQLAADLCMERTGLYKKLTALMQQPPVAFIRSIRLHRAAELIREGNHTITEISELTGFGTVSYFGKCFQREFGCKPSEYAANPD